MSTEYDALTRTRAHRPQAIAEAAARRTRRPWPDPGRPLFVIAADHPARGALGVRDRPMAMAGRADLLDRLRLALSRPGVDGVLGTPDILEDLLLLGALENRLAIGSMNRGGLSGATFELDDRFTAYDADSIATMRYDGGKMLCRIDPDDPGTASTLQACARAVTALAAHRTVALVEPLWVVRNGARVNADLRPESVIKGVSVGQALGATSAYTWLKLPAIDEMERVVAATTLPVLLLGGDPVEAPDVVYARWQRALRLPGVRGLVVGRALLYPPDDDVAAAVDLAGSLLPTGQDA
ncbi:Cgl0159 family (beta/alpha)8-fold protein [Micromonospora sp. WMMD558]|uniref:Cgl0159 family (beta/alpha)8-fold protein n=1 Tax=unclassified Micromonospora TaxID=2617518 RepID=UPI0012B4DBC2|nr:deoxyribose-phosphate aldolase [Micromonospora sp. WMMC415]QGN48165.1 deoxyribose-phosphate aldolase [Micromonospora sp. WMMC415]